MTTQKSAAARGLGYAHRQQRERLLRNHVDGSPCWWCSHPMFRDPTKNWDGHPLEADHSQARSHGGTVADRLLHKRCNASRQDGANDHLRPAVTGIDIATAREADDQLGIRLIPWP
ncbi:hypothetical protein C7H75_05120 [Prescottella equi]|nr:hypothetical protein [Prescottella equi]AVP67327.1 hypothetical protein C7H75_04800 [Prescottella equi]AVP67386.1 hypothetical protein C7H75_05120 [Prescottella equi]